jgi:demethylmenaquinone methyltransferase/2-methoxy-6-polyprenyl-1,4-benzoquinol methylase
MGRGTGDKTAFFDNMASKWAKSDRSGDLAKAGLQLRLLDIRSGDSVLDVGTGTGVLIPLISEFTPAKNITAIDMSPGMISIARKNLADSEAGIILGDAMTHPFASESFDFVICYSVFPHFDDKRAAFRRLAGLLKRNGEIAIMHSASRRRINEMHELMEAVRTDRLPPMNILRGFAAECGLAEEITIDAPHMFIMDARKGMAK